MWKDGWMMTLGPIPMMLLKWTEETWTHIDWYFRYGSMLWLKSFSPTVSEWVLWLPWVAITSTTTTSTSTVSKWVYERTIVIVIINAFVTICRQALCVCAVNSGTSFLSGFAVFSIIGYMAKQQDKSIEEAALSGTISPIIGKIIVEQ